MKLQFLVYVTGLAAVWAMPTTGEETDQLTPVQKQKLGNEKYWIEEYESEILQQDFGFEEQPWMHKHGFAGMNGDKPKRND